MLFQANFAELRISCGDKDDFLRSKVPLNEIKNIKLVRTGPADKSVEQDLKKMTVSSSVKFVFVKRAFNFF